MDIERAVEDFVGKGKDLFRRRSCTFSPSKRPVLRFRSSAPTESSQSRLLTDARTVEPSTTMLMRTENQTKMFYCLECGAVIEDPSVTRQT